MSRDRIAVAVTQIEQQAGDAQARLAEVRALGFVPAEVGPEIPTEPARGPVRMVDMMASYPKGDDGFEVKPAGFLGRKTLRLADSFDVMAAKAARHKKPAPFTPAQVAMGRFYRDLVERHESAGVKCSSLESLSQRGGGGSGSDYMDAVLRDGRQIQALRGRIGKGMALRVVRRRGCNRSIPSIRLVNMVCLQEKLLSHVLEEFGWSDRGGNIAKLQQALAEALDRMMGPVHRHGSYVSRHPDLPQGFAQFAEAVQNSS